MNRLTDGIGLFANVRGGGIGLPGGAYASWLKVGQIARTNTSTFNLVNTLDPLATKPVLYLPAGAIPISIAVYAAAPSNAGTTATISVGLAGGSGTYFLNAQSVLAAGIAANAQVFPVTTNLFTSVGTAVVAVTGIYAETGTASSSGGPWNIAIEYVIP